MPLPTFSRKKDGCVCVLLFGVVCAYWDECGISVIHWRKLATHQWLGIGMCVRVRLFGVCVLIGTNTVLVFIHYSLKKACYSPM